MKRLNQSELALTQSLVRAPFDQLLVDRPISGESPLSARMACLGEVLDGLKEIESQCQEVESINATLGLSGVIMGGLAISSCAALGVLGATVVPVIAGAAVLGLLGSAGSQQVKVMKLENTSERIRLAMLTSPLSCWAALWQIAGTQLFLSAVEEAANCTVVNGQIHYSGDTPLTKAILKVSLYKGWTYDRLLDAVVDLAETVPMELPTHQVEREALPVYAPPVERLQTRLSEPTPIRQNEAADIVDLILQCTNSLVFIGGQRCGKSMLMAIASLIGYQRGRYTKVSVISSLTKPGEDSNYWKHCEVQAFYDLKVVEDKTPYYEKYIEVIREFKRTATAEAPQLLIIDEFAFLAQSISYDASRKGGNNEAAQTLIRQLVELGSVISSATEKNGWYVWFGSPQGNVGDFAEELRPVIKKLPLCYAAIAPGASVRTSTGGALSWDVGLYDATKRNWTVLDGNTPPRGALQDLGERIVNFNGKWLKPSSYTLETKVAPVDQRAFKDEIAKRDVFSAAEREVLNERVATLTREQQLLEMIQNTTCTSIREFVVKDLGQKPEMVERAIEAVKLTLDKNDAWKLARHKNWI